MKEMKVKSEFKVHNSIVYLDKNVENPVGNKFLLSLGYDEYVEPTTNENKNLLLFKVWDFVSLDSKYQKYLIPFRLCDCYKDKLDRWKLSR